MDVMQERLRGHLEDLLPEATVYLNSRNGDGKHFEAIIISATFEGQPLVQQHRTIMSSLKEAFEDYVHALALRTYTPARWEEVKDQYPAELLE